ncbi:hypothetical protein SCG7086_AA_00740 [Chlamydiales bacterium SCGC AG-110-P3]|nr:hypothetical protein SCG7086_AA_00740 [Chlamydiales bacterium SCGC AG-110-P3]
MKLKITALIIAAITTVLPLAQATEFVLDWDLDANGNVIAAGQVISSPNDSANPFNPGIPYSPYSDWGIDIQSYNSVLGVFDTALTFDSANPTGGDWDLETSNPTLNNILIIGENFVDNDSNGLVDDPDDQAGNPNAGYIELFMNDWDATDTDITFVDIDSPGHTADFFLDSILVHSAMIPALANGSVQTISFNGFAFDQMKLSFGGSGGIGEIKLTQVPEPCTFVIFGVAGAAAWRRRRQLPSVSTE